MVARIKTGISITGVINYNEHKVKKQSAVFLHGNNLPVAAENLTYPDKVNLFQNLVELQPRVKTNAVHISLNFDKSEHLSDQTLVDIADEYMEKLGFTEQPYLVYQHFDAEHPHIHIVTTNLTEERKRIDLHDIGKKLSEPARQQIEVKYNLVVATGKDKNVEKETERIPVAEYSKAGTKAQISGVVRDIAKTYAYASLAEYNTVLNRYGVNADVGSEGSKMRENKGLVYRITDSSGQMYGHSIKASDIYEKPTLKNLEAKFEKNKVKKVKVKSTVTHRIDQVFKQYQQIDQATFNIELKKIGIEAVYRVNTEGLTYGIQFIDLQNKVVFKASELGKAYSPAQLMNRFTLQAVSKEESKAVNHILESYYRDIKRSGPVFYFESTLIKALPKVDFNEILLGKLPELSPVIARHLINDFKAAKAEKLPVVLKQEQLSLKDRGIALINFINADNGLALKQKMTFLFSNNITLKQQGKDLWLDDDRGKGVHVQIPDMTVQALLKTKEKVNFILKETDRLPFTATEKKIFIDLGKGNRIPENPKYGTAYRVSFPRMNTFTPQPAMQHVGEVLNKNYLSEIRPKLNLSSGERLLDDLTSRGMLVQRQPGGELMLGYYRSNPASYFKVPEDLKAILDPVFDQKLSRQINELVYNERNQTVCARYEMMVKIKQYSDKEEYSAISKLIDRIKDKNPELHQLLKDASGKLFAANKKDPEIHTKNKFDNLVTQIIYNVVVNYPSKSLDKNMQASNQIIKNYIDRESLKLMNAIKKQGLNIKGDQPTRPKL